MWSGHGIGEVAMPDLLLCPNDFDGRSGRITVAEIAIRLNIGRLAVYGMLEQQIIPAIRLGRRWIVTRHPYEQWERTCGMQTETGLNAHPEVTVLSLYQPTATRT